MIVPIAKPIERIEFALKEVDRYREDVDGWNRGEDEQAIDDRVLEDLIAKANFLFGRILKLDEEIQGFLLANPIADRRLQDALRNVLAGWLDTSLVSIGHAVRLKGESGALDGAEQLAANIKQARAILTPDEEFFVADKLWAIRDEAVKIQRAGKTEPLLA